MTLDERELFDILSAVETPALIRRGEKIIYANPAARELFGADIQGAPARRVLPEELLDTKPEVAAVETDAGGVKVRLSLRRVGDMTLITAGRSAAPSDELRALVTSLTDALWGHLSICTLARDLVFSRARESGDVTGISYLSMMDRALHGIARVTGNAARALGDGFDEGFKFVTLDLGELVGDLVTTTAALTRQRGVEFIFLPPKENVIYRADPEKIELMLMELISNSLRHTDRGGKITVSVRTGAAGVLITVADTGNGLRGEALDHTFSRYSRPKTTKDAASGAGLGLTVAQAIAQAHGGRIIVGGTGAGASVTVSLPPSGIDAGELELNQFVPRSTPETFLTQYADVLDSSAYSDKYDM